MGKKKLLPVERKSIVVFRQSTMGKKKLLPVKRKSTVVFSRTSAKQNGHSFVIIRSCETKKRSLKV